MATTGQPRLKIDSIKSTHILASVESDRCSVWVRAPEGTVEPEQLTFPLDLSPCFLVSD